MDPLAPLFGKSALELFTGAEFVVSHGPRERLPSWMNNGALTNIDQLCQRYRGALDVAHGGQIPQGVHDTPQRDPALDFIGAGGQTPVRGASPYSLLRLGLTVYFRDLSEVTPESISFGRELSSALGLPPCVDVSAFANAPGSGLPLHHDKHDQLLFQLHGDKRITHAPNLHVKHPRLSFTPSAVIPADFAAVYGGGFPGSEKEIPPDQMESSLLKPGSCLFMPAGTWHRTVEQEASCLSVVVVVRAPSRLSLLQSALHQYASQQTEWRKPAYGYFDSANPSESESQLISQMLAELGPRIARFSKEQICQAFFTEAIADGNVEKYPLEAEPDHYIAIPSTEVSFEPADDGQIRCTVRPAQTRQAHVLLFHQAAQKIVDHVRAQRTLFSLAQLTEFFPDFDSAEVAAFAKKLAQVGMIRPFGAPVWDES